MTSRHMKVNVENQIMANAPSPVRKAYFSNLYQAIAAEAETHAVESNNQKKKAESRVGMMRTGTEGKVCEATRDT